MQPQLITEYRARVVPALKEKFQYRNVHQVPRVEKVVLNCSVGSQPDRKQAVEDAVQELSTITGQKPIISLAKKSVSNFKLREGEPIAARVTLRGRRMYEFLARFMFIATPRIRDFRGLSPKSFDGRGNYTVGIADQSIFPEIELDKIKRNLGFDITVVTTANTDDEARALLKEMGMPLRALGGKSAEEGEDGESSQSEAA